MREPPHAGLDYEWLRDQAFFLGHFSRAEVGQFWRAPKPQVFDESAYHSTEPTWTYETDTVKFSYYKYEVVTVDNETFGVEAGHEGTFHVFTAYAQDAGAAPLNEEAFDVYSTLFDDTIAAVTTHGGWEHLAAALDLE